MNENPQHRLAQLSRLSKGKRWDKILRGMWTAGKYSLPSVALALSGCVPSPNVVSVSPDGRYVVVPMNQGGVTSHLGQPSRIVLFDTKTGKVEPLGETVKAGLYWVDAAAGVAVYAAIPAQGGGSPSAFVVQDGKTMTIKDAIFPTLSDDGRQVVYVGRPNTQEVYGRLMRRDLNTGKTHDLHIEGAMPDISPDGKRVLFVTKADDKWRAAVAAIDGSDVRRIAEIDSDAARNVFPRWIDNESFLFRTTSKQTGADSELFIADLMGNVERVTDNDVVDVFPQTAGRDRVLYLAKDVGAEGGRLAAEEMWISEKRDGKWTDRKLGIRAYSFRVMGDDILYLVPKGKNTCELFRAPLDDPKKSTNLSQLLREKVKDLPAAPQGG